MSRGDGFAIADVATDLLDDDKVRALWRELGGDLTRMTHALVLHEATLLGSWRAGCRVTVAAAAPLWLPVDQELVAALQRVRLLDGSGRITAKAWHSWFDPAAMRREARRRSGELGGLRARGKRSESDAKALLQRRHSKATPDRSDRTGPTVVASAKQPSRRRAREEVAAPRSGGLEDARSILRRNGVLPVRDNGSLLGEPMPVGVSATIAVEGEPA